VLLSAEDGWPIQSGLAWTRRVVILQGSWRLQPRQTQERGAEVSCTTGGEVTFTSDEEARSCRLNN
jgi:hypothetical protein